MVKVSVVIPVYNREDSIARAIESALSQTLSDIEVIVVDDASTDETVSVSRSIDDKRVVVLTHDVNRGGSAARNTGVERAKGDYIAFLDSDDEWHPAKLERQVACLEERTREWGAAYCGFEQQRTNPVATFFDEKFERDTGKEGGEELIRNILLLEFAHGGSSTLLVRSELVNDLDGFDASFRRHQDWEFLVRLLKRSKLAYVDQVLVTKHDSGAVDLPTAIDAKHRYLSKFSPTVIEMALAGEPVIPRHRFSLAKIAFRNGRFRTGLSFLRRSSAPTLRDYLGLIWAIYARLSSRN